jgi:rubredoxin
MPWRCPSCGNRIAHDESDATPTPGAWYRCHVCHVDLEYRASVGKFVIVRRDDDTGVRRPRKS